MGNRKRKRTNGDEWSGRRRTAARAVVAAWLPAPCARCTEDVHPDQEWVVGHKIARSIAPHLTWVVSNWQPEHKACSERTKQAAVIEKAKLEAVGQVLDAITDPATVRAILDDLDGALFPLAEVGGTPPTRSFSLPSKPSPTRHQPVEPRDGLTWSTDTMRAHPWLVEFAHVPDDASPPLWMSPPPADAVGSYGAECIGFARDELGIELRWWQRLALTRQLEHRADGSLCHRNVIESCPRRAGKSVRMRVLALWRMHQAERFGEIQNVVHTGSDLAICREIQRGAWRWCEERWGKKSVSKANGKEAVEGPDTSRWIVRAQTAVYGYDVQLGLGDECWDVDPGTISEGLEPAMLERSSPQLHLTSTAHRRATSLMPGRISTALTVDDGETLLMVWGAPVGSDPSDPAVWRAASPHWTPERAAFVAGKWLKAEAGEVDPQADDPDPVAGFVAQYLNIWRLTGRAEPKGTAVVTEDDWHDRIALPPDETPDAAAIESWFTAGVSLALAWREDRAAIVSVTDHRDLADAVAALRRTGYRGRVTLGASLADDPAVKGKIRVTLTKASAGAAVAELTRLMAAEDALQHDAGEHLTGQVLAVRTQPGTDGPRLVSRERADAVKAAAWAAVAARARAIGSGFKILTASNATEESSRVSIPTV